jgi:hypothetical protein
VTYPFFLAFFGFTIASHGDYGLSSGQSTIIPAVFDLAPNRQITANWQIRRHCAGRGEQPI